MLEKYISQEGADFEAPDSSPEGKSVLKRSKEVLIAAAFLVAVSASACVKEAKEISSSALAEFLKKHPEVEKITPTQAHDMVKALHQSDAFLQQTKEDAMDSKRGDIEYNGLRIELDDDPNAPEYYATILGENDVLVTDAKLKDENNETPRFGKALYHLEKNKEGKYTLVIEDGPAVWNQGKDLAPQVETIIDEETGAIISSDILVLNDSYSYRLKANESDDITQDQGKKYTPQFAQKIAERGSQHLADLAKQLQKKVKQ